MIPKPGVTVCGNNRKRKSLGALLLTVPPFCSSGLALSVESRPTSSSRASIGWKTKTTSRNSFRNTRTAWGRCLTQTTHWTSSGPVLMHLCVFSGVNPVDTLTKAAARVLLAQTASTNTPFLMDVWRRLSRRDDRTGPTGTG